MERALFSPKQEKVSVLSQNALDRGYRRRIRLFFQQSSGTPVGVCFQLNCEQRFEGGSFAVCSVVAHTLPKAKQVAMENFVDDMKREEDGNLMLFQADVFDRFNGTLETSDNPDWN